MDLKLHGKTALITGASKGIGRTTALTMAGEGVSLYLAARSGDELEAVKKEILSKHKVKVEIRPGDLSTTESMVQLANWAGAVDILFNNAGDIPGGPDRTRRSMRRIRTQPTPPRCPSATSAAAGHRRS